MRAGHIPSLIMNPMNSQCQIVSGYDYAFQVISPVVEPEFSSHGPIE